MPSRKQTPDVLTEVLGVTAALPQPRPAPKRREAPAAERAVPKESVRPKAKPLQWEYREVVFHDYGGFRPRCIDGEEQRGWKQAPLIRDYLNQMGAEGWELAALGPEHDRELCAFLKRRKD